MTGRRGALLLALAWVLRPGMAVAHAPGGEVAGAGPSGSPGALDDPAIDRRAGRA